MSLKAWVAKKGGGKIDRKNIIESMGCQEGKGGGEIIESIGCQEEAEAGRRIDKNKMLDNMGCQS